MPSWRCLACGFAHNNEAASRCVGCDTQKGTPAAASAVAARAQAAPSPLSDAGEPIYLSFQDAFALWCDERGQRADNFVRDAMARCWDLLIDDSPLANCAAAPGQRRTALANGYRLIDGMAMQSEYNQLLKAANASDKGGESPGNGETSAAAAFVTAAAAEGAPQLPSTPVKFPQVAVSAPPFSPLVQHGLLHPALEAVASKLSDAEVARIQRVIDSATRRIDTLTHRLSAMEAAVAKSLPPAKAQPLLLSSSSSSLCGEQVEGSGSTGGPATAATTAAATAAAEPGQVASLEGLRAEWDEADARDLEEVERRIEEQDRIARKQALEAASAAGKAAASTPADATNASSSDTSSTSSTSTWSSTSAAASSFSIPNNAMAGSSSTAAASAPADALAAALFASLQALGQHMSTRGVALEHVLADLTSQRIAVSAASSANIAAAWASLHRDGLMYECAEEQRFLPSSPEIPISAAPAKKSAPSSSDSEEAVSDPFLPQRRALRAVLLSLLQKQSPRCVQLSALTALVRRSASDLGPQQQQPSSSSSLSAAATSSSAAAAADSTSGVWGCSCSSLTGQHGANCSNSMQRSRPPPASDLQLESQVAAALQELQQLKLVEQPVARNFRAAPPQTQH